MRDGLIKGGRPGCRVGDRFHRFRRLLYRLDELARQYAGGDRRDRAEVSALYAAAERVRLVEARTRLKWCLFSGSMTVVFSPGIAGFDYRRRLAFPNAQAYFSKGADFPHEFREPYPHDHCRRGRS